MKKKIVFYSDCAFFAGCENMLVNFFQNTEFTERYDVAFFYRYSREYEAGYRQRVGGKIRSVPVRLPDPGTILERKWPVIRPFVQIFSHLVLKHLFIIWNTLKLHALFKKERIDILHVNNGGYPGAYSCASAVMAARLAGIRNIVYVVNNIARSYGPPWRWLDLICDRVVFAGVSHFVTGSAYARKALVRALYIDTEKALNIFNGIEPRTVTETREETLRRLKVDARALLIGVVAVLEHRKGHTVLIDAIAKMKVQQPSARLPLVLIEGEGEKEEFLKGYVREKNLDGVIIFIGPEQNVFNFMNAVDIIVLPSIAQEDFPNVVIEAMSLGKPVIASSIAGTPEQITHMRDGLLVEPGNSEELARAIGTLAHDSELRQVLASNAREKFRECFSAQKAVASYERIYEKLTA